MAETPSPTSPSCAPCRASHRACRRGADRFPCSTCLKRKIHCPGPPPYRPLLNAGSPSSPSSSSSPRSRQVSLGPSSSSWRLSSNQLSFALRYHLVQLDLANRRGVAHQGLPNRDPLELKFGSVGGGRVSELPLVEELAAHTFLVRGSRYSNHSALVGPGGSKQMYLGFQGPEREQNVESGLARRSIQGSLLDGLGALVERAELDGVPFPVALERLLLAYVALAVLYSSDTRRAVHDLCGLVLMRGMRLLAADPFRQADVLVYLSDLARVELWISLTLKLPSVVSPDVFAQIFPPMELRPPLYLPAAYDFDLITSSDASTLQAYERLKAPTFNGPLIRLLDEVTRTFSYFPAGTGLNAVKKCWKILDPGLAYLAQLIHTLAAALDRLSPRSREDPPGRQADFIAHAFVYHLGHLQHLWSCHLVLEDVKDVDPRVAAEWLEQSSRRLDLARINVANHTQLLMSVRSESARKDMIAANKLVQNLDVSRGPSLSSWCERYPQHAKIFLRACNAAAWGYPDAARLALELRDVVSHVSSPPTSPSPSVRPGQRPMGDQEASDMVEKALEALELG